MIINTSRWIGRLKPVTRSESVTGTNPVRMRVVTGVTRGPPEAGARRTGEFTLVVQGAAHRGHRNPDHDQPRMG